MSTDEQTRTDRDHTELWSTVQQLNVAIRKLPECGDAARVRGIAHRLAAAAGDASEPVPPLVRRLAAAVRDAVDADPWVAIDRLVHRMLEICESPAVDHVPVTTSTHSTARKRMSERRRNPKQEELRKRRAEQEERWNIRRTESPGADAENHD
jgi:hypothetical protein